MQKNKIEVAKGGAGKTMFVPLSVYRKGKSLTISYPAQNSRHRFKFGTTPQQLEKFRAKLDELFEELVISATAPKSERTATD